MRAHRSSRRLRTAVACLTGSALLAASVTAVAVAAEAPSVAPHREASRPIFSAPVAPDVSPPMSALTAAGGQRTVSTARILNERGAPGAGRAATSPSADAALQTSAPALAVGPTIANFEGVSNQDNFNLFGGRVNPPDPIGDVGPNHYVEMTNLAYQVFDKSGTPLIPATPIGALWAGFAVNDCTEGSGDPVVLYDQLTGRWLLSQFTTSGLDDPTKPFWNCVAISTTGDPTGTYYRYAFKTENFQYFPDYPKYGVWTDSYVLTTREFGPTVEYGIGVYALEKNKMVNGQPARVVSYFLDGNAPDMLPLVGDGLLPADIDGMTKPREDSAIPIVGTQDDGGGYGATSDALNVWDLRVKWRSTPTSSLTLARQLPVAAFDSQFPCAPTARDCLPQPGITDPNQYLDVLSYRQRPTWRLAYRSFKGVESLVTAQSVEASPGQAGMRWYEVRRGSAGTYAVAQQGTYAPADGVHRWMGSIAQDKKGNMALGYSVVNGVDVYPGIRYTGRSAAAPLGTMNLAEGTIINGSGVQTTTNSRWGDYTSMNVDPSDDCTFWYVNEYYTAAGQASSPAGWQTRIASFRLPGC